MTVHPDLIFKIVAASQWREALRAGHFDGSKADRADGYIHFSTAAQAPATAAKWFAGVDDLMLVAIDAASLGPALRWEPSRGGELFPHLYGALLLGAVRWSRPLLRGRDGMHIFGALTS